MDKLRAEVPGVLAWAVRGCLEWQRDGLKLPPEVQQATKEYRTSEDVLATFLAEKCLVMPGMKSKALQLYGAFKAFCKETGETEHNQRQFGRAMTARGFERMTNNGKWYLGVGLTAEAEREATDRTEP